MEARLFYLFGRPLVLDPEGGADDSSKRSSDGVHISVAADPQSLAERLQDLARKSFVYLRLRPAGNGSTEGLTALLRTLQWSYGAVVSSSDPRQLTELWQAGIEGLPRLAYRPDGQGSMDLHPPCPYDGFEIPLAKASHDYIRAIHSQGKEVYVDEAYTRSGARQRERKSIEWLEHEQVDLILRPIGEAGAEGSRHPDRPQTGSRRRAR
jgi:hypothetical protein